MRRLLAPLLLLFVFAACDSSGENESPRVDLDAVFAAPTQTEKATILADWSARTPVASSHEVVRSQEITLAGRTYAAKTYRYVLDGLTLYGLVLVPGGADASMPVIVYGHGGDGGVSLAEVTLISGSLLGGNPAVIIAPTFRDEPLDLGAGGILQSDGPASPWDRDVDDALALLNVVLDSEPVADPNRIGAMGLSRGAGVALLMGVRDSRITRVLDFFGPTDFFGPYVRDIAAAALEGDGRDLPGFDVLNARFIQPLGRGELSVEQMRLELLRRSPAAFADRLPAVQAHHGTADRTVLIGQTERLEAAMQGRADAEFFYWPNGDHGFVTIGLGASNALAFLGAL